MRETIVGCQTVALVSYVTICLCLTTSKHYMSMCPNLASPVDWFASIPVESFVSDYV